MHGILGHLYSLGQLPDRFWSMLVILVVSASVCCESRKPKKAPDPAQTEIQSLLGTIDDNGDILYSDITPSVTKLISIGEPAVIPTLDLMLVEDEFTRLHAQRVLQGITMELYGFVPGHGWNRADGEKGWERFWAAMGDLDWQASRERRVASVARWKEKGLSLVKP